MARPAPTKPTDWEIYLLHILWDEGISCVDDIRETLRDRGIKRSDSAIRTILRSMLVKELVKGTVKKRTTYYEAAMERPKLENKMFHHLVDTLFGGNQEAFALRVLDETTLTKEVAEKMREKLNQVVKKSKRKK